MQPGRQWKARIELWLEAIKNQVYKPLGEVGAEGFFTMDELSSKQALAENFVPIQVGTDWGKKWEYAWFKFQIDIPKEAEGKRIVCIPDVGAESLCYVRKNKKDNFVPKGAYDKQHKEIVLNTCAKEKEQYEFLLESYAGHGPRLEDGGPVPMEKDPVCEPPLYQCKMGHITYGIWQEEAYQLYIDAFVLWDLYQILDSKSLRAMEILDGLKSFTKIADVELEGEERLQSFVEARKVLAPLLACQNGSTAPLMSICGQSHLDLAWLWPYADTRRKTARTYSNQLTLMEEYPEYQFLSCDPFVLEVLQEKYPEVYEQYLKKVEEGNMVPEGVTYVEPDLNMICGEALFRHIMEGVEKFEKLTHTRDVKVLWLPDVFGFSGALPQVMKQCGIPYFATQKLLRQDPEAEAFPYNDFWWEGIDGSRVLSHIYMKNNTRICPKDIHTRWYEHRNQETGMDGMLYPFGFGDGGGGPTRDMLEIAKRVENLEGIPKTIMESPAKYFERMQNNKYKKPVYRGELYLAWHRGTYTAQSELKVGNRLAETALKEAEAAMAIYYAKGSKNVHEVINKEDYQTDLQSIAKMWDKLLFLQFHDILPGSSIQRVNEEARRDFAWLIAEAGKLSKKYQKVIGVSENELNDNESTFLLVKNEDEIIVHNQVMKVSISKNGTIKSIKFLESDREYQNQAGNVFKMYKNVNSCYDAWEMGSMVYEEEIENIEELLEPLQIIEQTDSHIILSFKKKIHHSVLEQRIIIHADETIIYFETKADWHERHKLLKVCFYPEVHTKEGIEEIQYGYVKRSFGENHQFEKDQYEVINHRYTALVDENHGMAILNAGKYGVHVAEKEISLSLLRAPVIPDKTADEGMHSFVYACMIYDGSFTNSEVTKKAVALQHMALHDQLAENNHSMNLINWFEVGDSTVIPDWCYKSAKHENMIVLRVYQSVNQESTVTIKLPFDAKEVWEITPFEEKIADVTLKKNREIKITCASFAIKTLGIMI